MKCGKPLRDYMRKNQSKYASTLKIGDVFGKWTVADSNLHFIKQPNGLTARAMVRLKCECGTEHFLRPKSLNTNLKGCYECSRAKPGKDSPSWKGIGDLCGLEYYRLQRQASTRNISFSLSKEYVWELFESQNKKCALSGIDITLVPAYYKGRGKKQTASLDRIDSLRGYEEGNVQWVHKDVNMMKNKYDEKYFVEICKLIVEHKTRK
jgi:hypothetical protein